MLKFFKNLFAGKSNKDLNELRQEIQEDVIIEGKDIESLGLASNEQLAEQAIEEEGIYTSLSLHETWDADLQGDKRYVLSFMQTSLPPIKEGQVAITGFNFHVTEEGLIAFGFIRNGLNRPIRFETIPLLFLGEKEAVVARKEFDLSEIGEVPPHSDRPWSFLFEDKDVIGKEISLAKWKLAFEIRHQANPAPIQLDIDESWHEQMDSENIKRLENHLHVLPPLQPGELNISGIEIKQTEAGDVNVLVFLRNGTDQKLNINQLPLQLLDATEEEVAAGLFKTGELEVKPSTAKPWRFIFPRDLVKKTDADFSRWLIKIPHQTTL